MNTTNDYDVVPTDYPYCQHAGAVAGVQPKLLLTSSSDGKFYSPGNSREVRWHDWKYSVALVTAMVEKCLESKNGKRSHMSEAAILLQYFERAKLSGRYGTESQLRWSFSQVAAILKWPLPDGCCPDKGPTSSEVQATARE